MIPEVGVAANQWIVGWLFTRLKLTFKKAAPIEIGWTVDLEN